MTDDSEQFRRDLRRALATQAATTTQPARTTQPLPQRTTRHLQARAEEGGDQ